MVLAVLNIICEVSIWAKRLFALACYNETLSWVWWLCVGTGTGGDCDPPRLQPGTLGGKYIPTGQYLMNPLMVPVWL